MIQIQRRATKSLTSFRSASRREMNKAVHKVRNRIEQLRQVDVERLPQSGLGELRSRIITSMEDAIAQTQARAAASDEVPDLLESAVKSTMEQIFPQNVEAFVVQNLSKIKGKSPLWFPLEPEECSLCLERVSDCRLLPGSSEGGCTCKEMPICVECMLRHYWENSNGNTRSFAVCPQCRGEFRLSCLIHVRYESRTALPAPSLDTSALSEQESPANRRRTHRRENRQEGTPYTRPSDIS